MINSVTRNAVAARAKHRCEYCLLPQQYYEATFNVDHIVASQHRHDDDLSNLSLSCPRCNRKEGPNLAGIDPVTQAIVPLFNPRTQKWSDHFRWNGPLAVGITAVGRATLAVLEFNDQQRIKLRTSLMAEGLFREAE